jgi:hypothetical protein
MSKINTLLSAYALLGAVASDSPYSRHRETKDNEAKWTPPKYKEKGGVVKPIPEYKFKKKLSKKQRKELNK